MASGFHMALSFSRVEAVDLNPCALASCLSKPIRRSAAFMVFSLIGRQRVLMAGKTKPVGPVRGRSSRNSSTTCLDNGTACGRRVFMRPSGIRQTTSLRSNSDQSAWRSSPGRTNT
jgi:hypothetical protein